MRPQIVKYNLIKEMEHGTYVSCLARDLAKELGLSDAAVSEIALAGLLHDIGKLRLPDYLCEKGDDGPLLVEELKYVRMHPMLSYEILKERNCSALVLESVRYHHEDYDGTGFPSNLKGEEIPLGARILRCCDVYAALTSDRPYRERYDMEEAIGLMVDEINHFDLKIFLAFQRVAHRVGTKYQVSFPVTEGDLFA